mgnify:CR=1 FL=1
MNATSANDASKKEILRMAVEVVASYVGRNQVPSNQLPDVIHTVFNSMTNLDKNDTVLPEEELKPAVPIRRSISPDYIVCLEDGKKLKMLKRHLRTTYGMTPDEYRAKWKLPHDYPMVAPNYAKQRSEFAKNIGLGKQSKRTKSRKKS